MNYEETFLMSNYKLSQINIFPIKSLPGISLRESNVEERGLKYDRRWMLVNEKNMFITQRSFPQLTLINLELNDNELILNHRVKKLGELKISLNHLPNKKINVTVWKDICSAIQYKKEINDWFSEAISFKCKLIFMPNSTKRKTSIKYYKESRNVSFADGYPFLIIGEESLNFLNTKLKSPILMNRFRPNFVFTGGKEHDEDKWSDIRIGELNFSTVKPCARCIITTINTENGKRNEEPLATLSTYRRINNKAMFGQNIVGHSNGIVKIGDEIFQI